MDLETTDAIETAATETAEEPKSFDERLMEFVQGQVTDDQAEGAATDSATDDAAVTETVETAEAADTKETPATVETKTTATTEPPFTEEQLDDDAFFDKLDEVGWTKLKVYSPALFKMGKQVARLRGRAGAALKNAPAEPTTEERTPATPPKVSDAMKVALRKQQSLDEDEALEGAAEVARLTVREERAREREEEQAHTKEAQGIYLAALEMAIAELPELENIADADLDKELEATPKLMRKLQAARTHPDRDERIALVADVMEQVGRAVVAKRQTATQAEAEQKAADKKAEDQKRLRSNELNPTKHLVETPGGTTPRSKPKSFETDGLAFIQGQMSKTGN